MSTIYVSDDLHRQITANAAACGYRVSHGPSSQLSAFVRAACAFAAQNGLSAPTTEPYKQLFIFDKDGTVVAGPDTRPPNAPEEQTPRPGVVERLAKLRAAGHTIALASNQGGVAWGFISDAQANALMQDAAAKIGGVAAYRYSPYDPRAAEFPSANPLYARDDHSRKPNPGMLLELMAVLGFDPIQTTYIGDQPTDQDSAQSAGVRFAWAADFFR